jgi:hypothetical protein
MPLFMMINQVSVKFHFVKKTGILQRGQRKKKRNYEQEAVGGNRH